MTPVSMSTDADRAAAPVDPPTGVTVHVAGDLHLTLSPGPTPAVLQSLQRIEAGLSALQVTDRALVAQGVQSMADLQTITDKLTDMESTVATDTDVKSSAATLLASLSALIAANKNDPAAIQAIADRLAKSKADVDTSNASLAAAVAASTVAA